LEAFYIKLVYYIKERVKWVTYVHGIATSGLFTSVALGKSPVEGVGKSVFTQVREHFLVDLKSREVGCSI
jgi:hypothetical protein